MWHKKFSLCVLILILLSSISLTASTLTKQFSRNIGFQSNGDVHVKNINGNIKITSWDKDSVRIEAEIKVSRDNPREAERFLEKIEIIIERADTRLTIEPDYPENRGNGFWDWVFGSNNPPLVHFKISVPRQINMTIQSTNGGIEAYDIVGETKAQTVNGGIEIEDMQGSLRAHTVNGSISADVTQFDSTDEIDLNTTNGAIEISLSPDVKADVTASTVNGSIRTEFTLTVKGKLLKKQVRGGINGGGGMIDLATVNGSITINQR